MTTDTPHLAILICSATPDRPELCVTPLVHAIVARALDCDVEIHFAGPSVRFLVDGVSADLYPTTQRDKSVLAFLQEASAAGVRFLACSMAHASWVAAHETLIAECTEFAGATVFIVRTLDPEWRTLVF